MFNNNIRVNYMIVAEHHSKRIRQSFINTSRIICHERQWTICLFLRNYEPLLLCLLTWRHVCLLPEQPQLKSDTDLHLIHDSGPVICARWLPGGAHEASRTRYHHQILSGNLQLSCSQSCALHTGKMDYRTHLDICGSRGLTSLQTSSRRVEEE